MTEHKRTVGRDKVPDHMRKKARALTMADAEWNALYERAKKANKSIGVYLVEKLGL